MVENTIAHGEANTQTQESRKKRIGDETPNPLPDSTRPDSSAGDPHAPSGGEPFPADKTAPQRRQDLTPPEVRDLELAGGAEGGMQAGSAGPSQSSNDEGARHDPS
jgi:hypothetical protein